MADPFSVAGTAVGITSLGLQVCQGAFQYYAKFRSYHNDIEAVVQRTEVLVQLLKTLDSSRKQIELGDDEPSEQLLLSIRACYTGVQKLESMTKKFAQTKFPGGLHDITDVVRKRLLWPFRKDTLSDLQTVLNTLQDNLQLALQIIDVHVAAQHFNILSEASESIIQNTKNINHQLSGQTQMLRFLNSQIQALAGRVNHHDVLIRSHFVTQDRKYDMLPPKDKHPLTQHSHYMPLTQPISAWSTPTNSHKHYQQTMLPHSKSLSPFVCRCPRPKSETRKIMTSHFSLFWTNEPIHLPGCTFYVHQKTANALGTAFIVPGRKAKLFVDMAWTWGAGPLSYRLNCRNIVPRSSPAFMILSELQHFFWTAHPHQTYDEDYITKPLALTLQYLSMLFEMNRAGASDTLFDGSTLFHKAMEAIGSGLTTCNTRITANCISEISIFLHTLSAFGVPRNEKNSFGRLTLRGAPLDSLFLKTHSTPSKSRLLEIPGLVGLEWSWHNNITRDRVWSDEYYRRWSLMESSEHIYMEEPLYLSVLQKDLDGFTRHLSETALAQISKHKQPLLAAALHWPQGVEILLSRNIDPNILDARGFSALDHAISLESLDVINIILRSDICPTRYTWILSNATYWLGDLEVRWKFLVRISHWLRRHANRHPRAFFLTTFGNRSKHRIGGLSPKIDWSRTKLVPYTLYHENGLNYLAANALFEAGFRDIDVPTTDEYYLAGTPLWMHACSMYSLDCERTLPLLTWLISKGANLHKEHWHLTTPVHAIFERIIALRLGSILSKTRCELDEVNLPVDDTEESQLPNNSEPYHLSPLCGAGVGDIKSQLNRNKTGKNYENDDSYSTRVIRHPFRALVNQVWENRTTDSCNCACSSNGCSLVTVALKITRQAFDPVAGSWGSTNNMNWSEDTQRMTFVLNDLTLLSRYTPHILWEDADVCREALRVLTFDRLGLTHTCHNLGHTGLFCYPRHPLNQDEIKDIQYSEVKDLDLLEDLLSEFEPLWPEHPAGFEDFLHGHWADRMDEVIALQSKSREDEPGSVFRETGVILEPDNSIRNEGVALEAGPWKQFEVAVLEIVNGVT